MIITPAVFEDRMRKQETPTGALLLMEETLRSLGYEAGIRIFEETDYENRNDKN